MGHTTYIILLFHNEISPLAIQFHSSPIPMSMQSLKKIGQKVLKFQHGNEALTDRQIDGLTTDGRTLKVRRVLHNTPSLFVWWGIKSGKTCHLGGDLKSDFD